jgi:hypothetical protein
METIGKFETSNEMINQIHKECVLGDPRKLQGMPTDCPQRDERLDGWATVRRVLMVKVSFSVMHYCIINGYGYRRIHERKQQYFGGFASLLDNL